MDAMQSNKLAMYRAVRALLTNTTETSTIVALPGKLAGFTAKLDAIDALVTTQSESLRGRIADRNEVLAEAVDAALALAGIALSYADEKKLGGLAVRVRLKAGDFSRARLDQRVRLAQQVHDAIEPVLPQLADHGVTAPVLAGLQAKIDAAQEILAAPRSTTVAKKAATIQLTAAFRETDALLENRLDPLLLPLRKPAPEFYARYKAARQVIDRAGGRNAAPSEPIPLPMATPANSEPLKLAA